MRFVLPYAFDTTTSFGTALKLALGLEAILLVGIVYSAAFNADFIAVAQIGLIAAMAAAFMRLLVKFSHGSRGTLTQDSVTVARGEGVLGILLPGPVGRFPLRQFSHVRAEEAPGRVEPMVNGGPHARVSLVGTAGAPDILLMRVMGDGAEIGREIAAVLGLTFEDVPVPH
ncbi:MAG TPA: hypothetical protein VGY57_02480 [Vicinamibacterales bacterium]|jgi:hypothetical protein|nr:hypothetical protein [Vicinamibacterales bacterium]